MRVKNATEVSLLRGFVSGVIWGAILGAVILALFVLQSERRILAVAAPKAGTVEVPVGTEFDQARSDDDADLPQAEASPGSQSAAPMIAPVLDAPLSLRPEDRVSLALPNAATPEVSIEAPEIGDAMPGASPAIEAPVTPTDQGAALRQPGAEETPLVGVTAFQPQTETVQAPAAQAAPEVGENPILTTPGGQDAPNVALAGPDMQAPVPEATPNVAANSAAQPTPDALQAPSAPSVGVGGLASMAPPQNQDSSPSMPTGIAGPQAQSLPQVASPAVSVAPQVAIAPHVSSVQVEPGEILVEINPPKAIRLPQVDSDSTVAGVVIGRLVTVGDADAEPVLDETDVAPPAEDLPPLRAYGTPFENIDGKPLFSIVLVDDPRQPLDPASLRDFPVPLSIAIDVRQADAQARAAAYLDAGFEVLMRISMPKGAKPQDLEVAYQNFAEIMPQAIAVLDDGGQGFQSDRMLLRQMVAILADSGLGLLTYDKGLNAAEQIAGQSGVASALVFRVMDAEDESAPVIRRYLNRAIFQASQAGYVIMVGSTRPANIAAISEWAQKARRASVAVAPVSAVLLLQ